MERLGMIAAHLEASPCAASSEEAQLRELREKYGKPRPDGMRTRGMNHMAVVSSDMARTLHFYGDLMGLRLVKTVELPHGGGQHFFFDIGNGECLAFFWFPEAPRAHPGISSVDPKLHSGEAEMVTAIGSTHHVAFNCDEKDIKEYRARLKKAGVLVSPMLYHVDTPEGFAPSRTPDTTWVSFYFFGPDGEYLELTAQTAEPFTPEKDLSHLPRTAAEGKVL